MVARIQHYVSWLQISVNDLHLAQVLEGHDNLSSHVLSENVVQAALSLEEFR